METNRENIPDEVTSNSDTSTPPNGASAPRGPASSTDADSPGYTAQPGRSAAPMDTSPAASPRVTSGTGLEPNVAGALSYVLWWITGIVFVLVEKDRFVRFHAFQSILTFGGLTVVFIALQVIGVILGQIPVIGFLWTVLSIFIYLGLSVASLVLWAVLIIQAYQGKHFRMPVVGEMAERYADSSMGR